MDAHRVRGMPWVNLVVYLELTLAAAREIWGDSTCRILGLSLPRGLVLSADRQRLVHLTLTPTDHSTGEFQIASFRGGNQRDLWLLHAQGSAAVCGADNASGGSKALDDLRSRCTRPRSVVEFYSLLERHTA